MIQLKRITTEYVDAEDRIRLSGSDADGNAVQLWVTQRMLNRLVPHLFEWLQRQAGEGVRGEMLQEFAQHAAREALVPQDPVRVPGAGATLVCEVDVTPGEHALALAFKVLEADGSKLAVGTVTLEAHPLRQWLSIIHDQYAKAGWPLADWPAWSAPGGARAPTTTQLH